MTHSLDTFITDSANSASALYTGHKTTVNAMGCYVDSSKDVFDDPKVETIAEIFRRIHAGAVGIVSTAYLADATPAAITGHTRDRSQAPALIDQLLHGMTNYTWTNWTGPDVLFGGGAENFYDPSLGGKTYKGKDYYKEFEAAGYKVVQSNTELQAASNDEKTLGVFSVSNMAKWLDRNVSAPSYSDKEISRQSSHLQALTAIRSTPTISTNRRTLPMAPRVTLWISQVSKR